MQSCSSCEGKNLLSEHEKCLGLCKLLVYKERVKSVLRGQETQKQKREKDGWMETDENVKFQCYVAIQHVPVSFKILPIEYQKIRLKILSHFMIIITLYIYYHKQRQQTETFFKKNNRK